ncbi:hypothetical protein HL42_7670 [Trichophyton rubrum]|nr:hypothetical protein HL42_7670 [Trichophyton rubrum]
MIKQLEAIFITVFQNNFSMELREFSASEIVEMQMIALLGNGLHARKNLACQHAYQSGFAANLTAWKSLASFPVKAPPPGVLEMACIGNSHRSQWMAIAYDPDLDMGAGAGTRMQMHATRLLQGCNAATARPRNQGKCRVETFIKQRCCEKGANS